MFKFVNKMKNRKGFTLVELVVVIAILGILAAIAVPRLLGFQDRAREQADKQMAVQVKNALSLLTANGELGMDDDGDATIDSQTFYIQDTGTVGEIDIFSGLADSDMVDADDAALTVADVEDLLEELISDFDLQSDKFVKITMDEAGSYEADLSADS